MNPRRVDFDDQHANFKGSTDPHPLPRIRVDVPPGPLNPAAASWSAMGLLDTGATGLYLPTEVATQLGIPLTNAVLVSVWTANGSVTMERCAIDVSLHGVLVQGLETYFFPNQRVLVGLDAIFQIIETIGFEQGQWLRKEPP